ncbi:poly-D-alanine transfer protein DltD [Sphingobacterium zeae]|uniref:Poly-D-alanine transfer protein DltD n=1 Tax=Sphingobacterium zeae TaxID=1776859 RepID=A0ABU0U009_9SPHI|nr:hypothetical protein [Sphingobacterium zeae]MDQ1148289.1 poly-D-alanine transfer protein DltD [Sphingobacterium zeae]
MRNVFFFILICFTAATISCRNNKKEDKAVKIIQDSVPVDTIQKRDTLEKEVKKQNSETLEEVLEKLAKAYSEQDSKNNKFVCTSQIGDLHYLSPRRTRLLCTSKQFQFF